MELKFASDTFEMFMILRSVLQTEKLTVLVPTFPDINTLFAGHDHLTKKTIIFAIAFRTEINRMNMPKATEKEITVKSLKPTPDLERRGDRLCFDSEEWVESSILK